jgi:hypothetical protein
VDIFFCGLVKRFTKLSGSKRLEPLTAEYGQEIQKCLRQIFRGREILFDVNNRDNFSTGIKSNSVESSPIEGQLIPVFQDGKEHPIEAIMG